MKDQRAIQHFLSISDYINITFGDEAKKVCL